VVRTPGLAPKSNAHCERLIGSVRRECLDHVLILGEDHLQGILEQYRDYYNASRPHQGIEQRRPDGFDRPARAPRIAPGSVISRPVLGGLHHDYRTAA
jgi:putative transposase